jgi:N-acetylmuramoyl-L-alanine amidase
VPLACLSDEYRSLVLLNLFPKDRRDGDDWIHVAKAGVLPTYDEGLWQIADWFTGSGGRFDELRRINGLASPEVSSGVEVRIPGALLHRSLRATSRSDNGQLVYGEDAAGPFAGYRLKPGEALWSAVVLRFTGRTSPEDVTTVAQDLARRSGVSDPTDMPVNYLVKIPLEVLEPEFLPRGDPRRREAEAAKAALQKELERKPVAVTRGRLKGVLVVLDPGHGGRDLGTIQNGVWEHDYVYDVACRLKQKIERETAAHVVLTLEDAQTGCRPSEGDVLVANRQGTVRSSPPFLATSDGEAEIAVHLRWYVANAAFRKAVREKTDPDRVVFLSLHADSRHASSRGVMVYAPGASYRTSPFGPSAATYTRFREVRDAPRVKLTKAQRIRSEAVSRKLAGAIVRSFGAAALPVQPYTPVRNEVVRGGERWLPAVLRGSAVPASVLVEMVNIGNRDDAALLAAAATRERMSGALFRSLFAYFGEKPPAEGTASASR